MPATTVATLPEALAPLSVGTRNRSRTIPDRSRDSASRVTGSNPVCGTNLGSSNEPEDLSVKNFDLSS
jgi:hypothetical protein